MDLVNESGLEVAWIVTKLQPPGHSLTVMVKGTFKLCHGKVVTRAEEQLAPTGDEFEEGNQAKTLRYPMDFAPFKPRADLLLIGRAYAEGGKPVAQLQASFQVGRFTKTLVVTGDRAWDENGRSGAALPFLSLPLTWEQAFGGETSSRNPVGKGAAEIVSEQGVRLHLLPNVEYPDRLVTDRHQLAEPAGFGPIPEGWSQRLKKFGKIDGRYMKDRWPWYPENLDWAFFNAAPEDQQIEGYLRGDEEISFNHLHPTIAQFKSQLPGLRPRCIVNEQVRAHEELREVPLRLDTLWAEPDAEKLVLVWRGTSAVRTEKLLEINHLYVATESLTSAPAALSDFGPKLMDALARREADDEELELEDEPPDEDDGEGEQFDEIERVDTSAADSPTEAMPAPAVDQEPDEPELTIEVEDETADQDETLTLEQVLDKLKRRESFEGCDFADLVLTDLDFSELNLREAIFDGAVLIRCNLCKTDLTEAVLTGANLREAKCAGASFIGADLTGAWLFQTDLTEANLSGADLSKARLREAKFLRATLVDTTLEEADLTDADFTGADLTAADLSKARLHRTNFSSANLSDAAFEGAWGRSTKARGAILRKVRAASSIFCEADFQEIEGEESVWQFAQLYAANFTRAQLNGAEFSSSYLGETIFEAAELKSACLDEANLRHARLHRANLFGASLDKADLSGADFTESNLYGASLMETTVNQTRFLGANLRRIKTKEASA